MREAHALREFVPALGDVLARHGIALPVWRHRPRGEDRRAVVAEFRVFLESAANFSHLHRIELADEIVGDELEVGLDGILLHVVALSHCASPRQWRSREATVSYGPGAAT